MVRQTYLKSKFAKILEFGEDWLQSTTKLNLYFKLLRNKIPALHRKHPSSKLNTIESIIIVWYVQLSGMPITEKNKIKNAMSRAIGQNHRTPDDADTTD